MRRFPFVLAFLLLLVTTSLVSADNWDLYHGQLNPTSSGGPRGHVTVQRAASGDYLVRVTVWGLAPDSGHAMHFHRGSCAAQGPVIQPLPPAIADRAGVAHVTAWLAPTQWNSITSAATYVNIHVSARAPIGPGITCADIGAG